MTLKSRYKALLILVGLGLVVYTALIGARIIKYYGQLENATKARDPVVMRILLVFGADPSAVNPASGNPPLVSAADEGNLREARILLRAGANPEGSGDFSWRPLFIAAQRKDHRMSQLLIDHGAIYDLAHALFLGDMDFVEQRLEADPTAFTTSEYYGAGILCAAVEMNDIDAAKMLLENGVSPLARTKYGMSSLSTAQAFQSPAMVELLESYLPENGGEQSGDTNVPGS